MHINKGKLKNMNTKKIINESQSIVSCHAFYDSIPTIISII